MSRQPPSEGSSSTHVMQLGQRFGKRKSPVSDFPRIVQIQTLAGCNARCQFCPNTATIGKLKLGLMDEDLFRSIIDEVVKHPVMRISPFLMNEPLSDKRMPGLIRYIVERKPPRCVVKINTNASFLDDEMGEALIESGLDRLHVSFHGIRKQTYETSMGNLDWEQQLAKVDGFLELMRKRGRGPRLKVTMVHTSTIDAELDEIRAYWNSRGVTVNVHALENRSHRSVDDKRINALPWQPLSNCDRLMQQAYILWNGDCVLCCVDWERTTIFGNVSQDSLAEVWQGEAYTRYRQNYLAGELGGTLCEGCKVQDEVDFSYKPPGRWRRLLLGRKPRYAPIPPPRS